MEKLIITKKGFVVCFLFENEKLKLIKNGCLTSLYLELFIMKIDDYKQMRMKFKQPATKQQSQQNMITTKSQLLNR